MKDEESYIRGFAIETSKIFSDTVVELAEEAAKAVAERDKAIVERDNGIVERDNAIAE